MNVGAAIKYPFKNKGWFVNSLMMFVCQIIPIIGPLVLFGYQVVLTKSLIRNIDAAPLKFDFGNFMKYLQRGVTPFLVALVAGLVLMPIIFLCWLPMIITAIVAGGHGKGAEGVVLVMMLISLLLEIGGIFVFSIVTIPLILRAELEGNFGASFKLSYILAFTKKMWLRCIVMMIMAALVGMAGVFIGLLACGVGVYIAATLLMLFQAHLRAQIYLDSIERGVPALVVQPDELVTDSAAVGFEPIVKS